MSTPGDDKDLDDLLAGRSDLTQRYRASNPAASTEEPPAELDRAVLAKARAAVEATPASVSPLPLRNRTRWMVPFALAASVLLTIAIFRESGNETGIIGELSTDLVTEESVAPDSAPASAQATVEGESLATAPSRGSPPVAVTAVPGPVQEDRAGAVAVTRDEVARKAVDSRAAAPVVAASPPAVEPPPPPPPAAPFSGSAQALRVPVAERASSEVVRAEADAAKVQRTPEVWLEDVRKLRAAGQGVAADEELQRFLVAYPDYFTQNPGIARP